MVDESSLVVSFDAMSLFRPPIVRSAGAKLDRALFSKTVPIAAARITNLKNLSRYKTEFERTKELLKLSRLLQVRSDPEERVAAQGGKCILLKPEIKPEDPTTWSPTLQEAVREQEIKVIPYDLTLDYDYWTYYDIAASILPEDDRDEIPHGFSTVGHVAHLNLKKEYLPYKRIIAEVLKDKNPLIRTVINKTDDVGAHSEFRTFGYEVLAGPDDMNVEVREEDCIFRFDYSKVYWNTRLHTEHQRLVASFNPGDVVCDVMAGVGPFAIPAGKKGVFVWANDLNPDSFASLKDAVIRNKVQKFVRPFCEDGRTFIKYATAEVLALTYFKQNTISFPSSSKRSRKAQPSGVIRPLPTRTILTIPPTINHFIMNLPATAIEFLDAFKGLYQGHEDLFEPHTKTKLPMVHVHCFSVRSDDVKEEVEICERISEKIGYVIKPGDEELVIHEARLVSPHKRMFCASFRLPAEVAFRSTQEQSDQPNNKTGVAEPLVKWSPFNA